MGDATPAPSPASDPDGDVVHAGVEFSDLAVVGDVIAARSAEALHVGDLQDFRAETTTETALDAGCGDLTASAENFIVACGDEILQIPAADPADVAIWETDAPATTAVLVDGRMFAGNPEDEEITIYAQGEEPEALDMAHPTDQLIATPREGKPDSIVRIHRASTTIQNIDLVNERQGGTLRVGIGVGQGSPGEDGIVVVADTLAPEIAVYTTDDVVRLQQTAPVDDSPWGAAWDPERKLAWVASTAENRAIGHEISGGVPISTHEINTVADAHNIAFLPDGTFLAASATGEGLQIVDEPTGL